MDHPNYRLHQPRFLHYRMLRMFSTLTSRTPAYKMTLTGDENASSSAEEVAQAIRCSCFCQPSLLILRPVDVRRFSWLVYP